MNIPVEFSGKSNRRTCLGVGWKWLQFRRRQWMGSVRQGDFY